jgi:hypothetical protein
MKLKMKAFHNDPGVKEKYLARVRAHKAADEIVKGKYWEDGKGCAVGCTIHSSNHSAYETELGIPTWLARIEDTIFENLQNGQAKEWPEQFLSSIKIGANLDTIKAPFLIFTLENSLESLDSVQFDIEKFPYVKDACDGSRAAVKEMIRLHKEDPTAARSAAESAARSAAWSAAESAASAAWSAESAARSAAWQKFADKLLELLRECE